MTKLAAVAGSLLLATAVALSLVLIQTAFVIELFANIFSVPFTQELRWYGPSLGEMAPGLWRAIAICAVAGAVMVALSIRTIRRYD